MIIQPYKNKNDIPIGIALRDIEAGETFKIQVIDGNWFCDDIEFFNDNAKNNSMNQLNLD